ncbi:uncharacterized protein LOC124141399 [Haliotis rufescens]|uniref:uncharacterized protein LOC124141399 n=1 Tax=Haliotis rufescens TaxID=6454 RepID=UPI00201F7707|nr:uncharacterized protein LOC124141399 [Haliotis rufescens]
MYDMETIGVQASHCTCPRDILSEDDRNALALMESTCQKQGDRYVIGLPWKRDKSELPNNYALAPKRLMSLERGLKSKPQKTELYKKAMKEFIDKGWAEKAQTAEKGTVIHYLPHHGVYREDKESTPLRIVFDPASTFQGVSLNSFLYKGPSLLGNLLGILIRFRERAVAFQGDISKMFLQIRLPEADTQVHRFLWRDLDTTREPTVYRLMRVTFSDKPSPDMANFVMLKIARENEEEYPEATEILTNDRYMDDIIHSCNVPEEAAKLMGELDHILASGSFKIKK